MVLSLQWWMAASLLLNVVIVILLLAQNAKGRMGTQFQALEKGQDRLEQAMREEWSRGRGEFGQSFKLTREELGTSFQGLSETLGGMLREMSGWQRDRFEGFAGDLRHLLSSHEERTVAAIREMAALHSNVLNKVSDQIAQMTQLNEQKFEAIRTAMEHKLQTLTEENRTQLERMRATVDEKLHQTLEQRLGESFKLVSERLEQVHQGLGEMQLLASGVGDLKKVLTNVKTRGTLGEIQLETILEQTLAPDQFERNVAVRPGGSERVDFAVVLPGRDDEARTVWLPIDAKFPLEDYQRLVAAEEAGDGPAAAEGAKMLEGAIRNQAKSIRDKYLDPPATTDFALMFLPIEGLYAEVLRRPGLWDALQREYRVIVTGPTTITALLNSLQMGFRTLAIQKRSSEVWSLLGAVKTEFGKFGDVLEKTQKKLLEAHNTIDTATRRSRAIERRLRGVEALPAAASESPEEDEGLVWPPE